MILAILAVSIIAILIGAFLSNKSKLCIFSDCLCCVGLLFAVISTIAGVITGVDVSKASVLDARIAMYADENERIEQQVAEVVRQYQQYETDIFTEVNPESAITLVALYPDLKSDSLVQNQIELYTENNRAIKSLKDDNIKANVLRWWLYFGGRTKNES